MLFEGEYFSYPENALIYVNKIVDFTINEIETFPYKQTPIKLKNYGSSYIFYKSNPRTTWYIFFEKFQKQNSRYRNIKQSFSIGQRIKIKRPHFYDGYNF